MKNFYRILLASIPVVMTSACTDHAARLDAALELAGENRTELESVMAHYENEPEMHDIAEWLISNMPGHSSVHGGGTEQFADSVAARLIPTDRADELWDSLCTACGDGKKFRDIKVLNADFLIDNIDHAYRTWKHSPWHDEVSPDLFRKYVLPYRVAGEMLRYGWRDSLAMQYAPLVANVPTAKRAFEIIRKAVHSTPRADKFKFPHTLDPVALRNHFSNVCQDRCVYLAAVCRAVGLPVTIDNCGKWANYSNNTHTWVALVLDDGTYTIIDDDSIARKDNIIDSSIFRLNQKMPEWYPYASDFKKRSLKVWRQTFHYTTRDIPTEIKSSPISDIMSPRREDVSSAYGFNSDVTLSAGKDAGCMVLCSHALSVGWLPQVCAEIKRGRAHFKNLGDSVMVLPATIENNRIVPAGVPFYMSRGEKHEIIPDTAHLISTTLTRKYPMVANWHNRYSQIPSTRLEGSNNDSFISPDTLFTITDVPVYYNSAKIDSDNKYRYVRVYADLPSFANMDRLAIYDKSDRLLASEKKRVIDLEKPQAIGRIEYFPWNDGNFVVPGHDYELAYWDGTVWRAIDRQHSDGYSLTFDNIPSGALLILHDLTKGKEERPFTLQDGRQIWW